MTDKTLGRERFRVANMPSLNYARENATAVLRMESQNK